jgi:hypothetical protein
MNKKSFLYRNSLSIVIFLIFLVFLCAQAYTGWKQNNEDLLERGGHTLLFTEYLRSSHFVEATFENWESEFLQMGMYVIFTVFLRQQGSSESKAIEGKEEVDREPQPKPDAPWPVRKGGFWLRIYKRSLFMAFCLLFTVSFVLHFHSSQLEFNKEQALRGRPPQDWTQYISNSRFWFESFQNWQSEFIAVLSIVVLSIFLRQYGSPESKPVDAPHSETGS